MSLPLSIPRRSGAHLPVAGTLHCGLSAPLEVALTPEDVALVGQAASGVAIEHLLSLIGTERANGVGQAIRRCLSDTSCLVELRSGDVIRVVTPAQALGTLPLGAVELDFGISAAHRGG